MNFLARYFLFFGFLSLDLFPLIAGGGGGGDWMRMRMMMMVIMIWGMVTDDGGYGLKANDDHGVGWGRGGEGAMMME